MSLSNYILPIVLKRIMLINNYIMAQKYKVIHNFLVTGSLPCATLKVIGKWRAYRYLRFDIATSRFDWALIEEERWITTSLISRFPELSSPSSSEYSLVLPLVETSRGSSPLSIKPWPCPKVLLSTTRLGLG